MSSSVPSMPQFNLPWSKAPCRPCEKPTYVIFVLFEQVVTSHPTFSPEARDTSHRLGQSGFTAPECPPLCRSHLPGGPSPRGSRCTSSPTRLRGSGRTDAWIVKPTRRFRGGRVAPRSVTRTYSAAETERLKSMESW